MTDAGGNLSLDAGFAAATRDDWRRLVDAARKGAAFEGLGSKTYDGFSIQPLYQRVSAAQPVVGRRPGTAWTVLQRVDHPDPSAANSQARDDLENGATGLALVFAGSVNACGFGIDAAPATLARTLDGIRLNAGLAIELSLGPATLDGARSIAALLKDRGIAPGSVDLRTGLDPIGGFAMSGRAPAAWDEMAPHFAGLVGEFGAQGFHGPFAVADGRIVHNAGGSEAQELGFALATALAYLRAFEASGMSLAAARDAIYFRLAADADQLLTIGKFRALRKLWARIEASSGLTPEPAFVSAETAWRTMTRRDAHVNMLRAAVAVAAAGMGGADAISVLPYTIALGLPDTFARRIARNTQLVLLEESNLARVADPAAGSGALERITEQLCVAAWTVLQDTEKAGGICAALESGAFQQKVAAVCAERQNAIAHGTDVLTGTNVYPQMREAPQHVLDVPARAPPDRQAMAINASPLTAIRLAEPFEILRDTSDRILAETGARPRIFLATLGVEAEFAPRATFAKNFFAAAGIEAADREDGALPLAAGFKASGAALACLCGSDKSYDTEAAAAAATLKAAGATHIYLAGRPSAREASDRRAGVETYIFEGSDLLKVLQSAYGYIGA